MHVGAFVGPLVCGVCGSVCSLILSYLPIYLLIPSSFRQVRSASFVLGFYVLDWLFPVLKRDRHRWFVGSSFVVTLLHPVSDSPLRLRWCTSCICFVAFGYAFVFVCAFFASILFFKSVCTSLFVHLVELGFLAFLSLF